MLIKSIPDIKKAKLSYLIDNNAELLNLGAIRSDQKDFQYTAVKTEVEKAQLIVNLYEFSKDFIPKLGISKNSIHYYADMIEQAP